MILPSDNLKYNFEEYRGYIIASHKDNRPERNPYNLNIVFRVEDFPLHGYFVGYDDTKLHGPRKMHANNIEDAKCYVDWIIEVREKVSRNNEVLTNQNKETSKGHNLQANSEEEKQKTKDQDLQSKKIREVGGFNLPSKNFSSNFDYTTVHVKMGIFLKCTIQ